MSLPRDYVNFGPPFDDDSDADIILRSSVPAPGSTENSVVATDFLVHKIFLIRASSVFKSLLTSSYETLDQQKVEALKHGIKHDIQGNLLVLCLPEDRDTVHRLLTAIYPIDIVYPQTLETIIKTFAATRKYGMPSVLARFRTHCSRAPPVATAGSAFRAYAFASNEGRKEEALEAAQWTLSLPQTFDTYGSSLCSASGPALLALWKCRGMVVQAIKRGVDMCLEEVGDLRDWILDWPCDKDCCVVPTLRLREQFVTFTKRISRNFSMMSFFNFVQTMSSRVIKCKCQRQAYLDGSRLFDCLERHVRGQIEQMHDELLLLFNDLGEAIDPLPSGGRPRHFGAPFDRGDSDITLRSCDRVDFQVHKGILGIASAAFEDMFGIPGSSPHGQGQVKQVIDLTENSKILLHLLSAIYPMEPIVLDTVEDALSLLSACQKYQMDFTATCVRASMRARSPPLFTAENSFRTYGIASRYHLEEEALLSARLTLERPLTFDGCGEDLCFISGTDLFRLYGYRKECIKVARKCVERETGDGILQLFSRCVMDSLWAVPGWWSGHFHQRIADLPSPKTVTDRLALERALEMHRAVSGCALCQKGTKIDNICAAFEAKLSEVIDQVRLDGRT
ncbi:hypothetical protein EDB85DRAFT_1916398 [Lactarius pseudohatsudake]|nr:hypothetical protein EDB85DRAFT_1916398 [Lactarius pseudohatsudake]